MSQNLVGGQPNVKQRHGAQRCSSTASGSGISGFFAQEEFLLLNERLLLTAGVRQTRAATTPTRRSCILSQGGGVVPPAGLGLAAERAQAPGGLRPVGQPAPLRAEVHQPAARQHRRPAGLGHRHDHRGGGDDSGRSARPKIETGSTRRCSRAGRTSRSPSIRRRQGPAAYPRETARP